MNNWKHQEVAIERFTDAEFFGLLFDCGTGKTRTAIEISKKKNRDNTVFAPKNLIKQWYDALIDSGVSEKDIYVYNTTKLKTKKGRKSFEDFLSTF
jgi:superfamily II DNA or RNA helicase